MFLLIELCLRIPYNFTFKRVKIDFKSLELILIQI